MVRAAIVLVIVLAGCTGARAPDAPVDPAPVTLATLTAVTAAPASALPIPPTANAPAAPAFVDPGRLVGQTAAAIAAALGPPGFTRRDGPAEVWQYAGEDCLLYVFLYREEAEGRARVAHFEIRPAGDGTPAPESCFQSLVRAPLALAG